MPISLSKCLEFFDHEDIISLVDIPKPEKKTGFEDIYFVTELMETDLHRVIYSGQVRIPDLEMPNPFCRS